MKKRYKTDGGIVFLDSSEDIFQMSSKIVTCINVAEIRPKWWYLVAMYFTEIPGSTHCVLLITFQQIRPFSWDNYMLHVQNR